MSIDVKFAYVCRFKFTDLPGDDAGMRHCNQCNLDVTNLDAMEADAAARFLQDASESKRRICVAATVRPSNTDSCASIAPSIELAGKPAPGPKVIIDIVAPDDVTAEQCTLLMDILDLPDRAAVAGIFNGNPIVRLGAFWKRNLREGITEPLDKVGLKWTMTEVHFDDDLYWEIEARRIE